MIPVFPWIWTDMRKSEFLHIIRAAAGITDCNQFLVVGSQAILGHFLDRDNDFQFWESRELDIVPMPFDQCLADVIEGSIGELSAFDGTFGVHAHGVGPETAVFPEGWEDRAARTDVFGVNVIVPSPEDLAIAKYVAGREKDHAFIASMWEAGLLDYDFMRQLIRELPEREETTGILLEELEKRMDADSLLVLKERPGP